MSPTNEEWVDAMRDPQCMTIWKGRPDVDSPGGLTLTYFMMADRAEELGLLQIAAVWRNAANGFRPNQ